MKKLKFVVKWGLRGIVGLAIFSLFTFINALGLHMEGTPFTESFKIGAMVTLGLFGAIVLFIGGMALYEWATED